MRNKILLALSSVVLLSAGWMGMTGLPLLIALIPMLILSNDTGSSRCSVWGIFGWSALIFGLWTIITTCWVGKATPLGAIAPPLISIVLFASAFTLYHYVSKRAPKALAYAILVSVWIAAEYLYTVGELSFPWLTLGNGFSGDIWAVQWYDTTGAFGGSLWVLLCNILIYEGIDRTARKARIAAIAVVTLPLLVSAVKYVAYREPEGKKASVAVIQPNIEDYTEKYTLSQWQQMDIMCSLMASLPADVEYVITPESAISETLYENELGRSPELDYFRQVVKERFPKAEVVLGASTTRIYAPDEKTESARYSKGSEVWYDHFNSVIAVDSTQDIQLRHKSLLVVGAEKTPYYKYIRDAHFLTVDLGGISGHLGSDPAPKVFHHNGQQYGTAVCYEGIYGGYMGGFAKLGAQVIFIISNDGWWGDTRGHRQLFAFSRLRAVEMRRSIGRSANTGTSGFITPRGDVVEKLGWDKRGALVAQLPLNDKVTFYARHGDYIARIATYVFLLSLLGFVVYRFTRKNRPV